jgi:hypothetical protein
MKEAVENKEAVCNLNDLAVRAQTANSLGYDMRLVYADGGLRVEYVKRPADMDWVM